MKETYITVDLSSIIKIDNSIKTLENLYPSFTEKSIVDEEAIDVVKYAIKVGKVFPVYIGQISPIYYTSTVAAVKNIGIPKYLLEYFTFSLNSLESFKEKIYNKYINIRFAYDKTDSNRVWKENNIEVLE